MRRRVRFSLDSENSIIRRPRLIVAGVEAAQPVVLAARVGGPPEHVLVHGVDEALVREVAEVTPELGRRGEVLGDLRQPPAASHPAHPVGEAGLVGVAAEVGVVEAHDRTGGVLALLRLEQHLDEPVGVVRPLVEHPPVVAERARVGGPAEEVGVLLDDEVARVVPRLEGLGGDTRRRGWAASRLYLALTACEFQTPDADGLRISKWQCGAGGLGVAAVADVGDVLAPAHPAPDGHAGRERPLEGVGAVVGEGRVVVDVEVRVVPAVVVLEVELVAARLRGCGRRPCRRTQATSLVSFCAMRSWPSWRREHPSRHAPKVSVHETGPSTGKVMSLVTFDGQVGFGEAEGGLRGGARRRAACSRLERGPASSGSPTSGGTGEHERPAGEPR